jgi:hypothetical protein
MPRWQRQKSVMLGVGFNKRTWQELVTPAEGRTVWGSQGRESLWVEAEVSTGRRLTSCD